MLLFTSTHTAATLACLINIVNIELIDHEMFLAYKPQIKCISVIKRTNKMYFSPPTYPKTPVIGFFFV